MIAAIVQARMGSTRLPGKVLMPAAGRPLLAHLLERLGRSRTVDRIVVATSVDQRDDPIVACCESLGVATFRGSENDVLDRYHGAAVSTGADLIVRVTADCPLVDPMIVDAMVQYAIDHDGEADLVTNRHPLTFPDGLDLDVIPSASLARAWREARTGLQREHVIPYFWDAGLRVHNLEHPANLYLRHRWTLDYAEDYAVIRHLIEALCPSHAGSFTMDDLVRYAEQHPELARSNAQYIVPQTVPQSGRLLALGATPTSVEA